MNSEEFREYGRQMIDFISDYLETIEKRDVTPNVKPNFLKQRIPLSAPNDPEPFTKIMQDVDAEIMPGITHWQHPNFHGYFPLGISYPSILADMLCNGLGILGFVWDASPSCTELETIVLDWLGKAIGLPRQFLSFPYDDDDSKFNNLASNTQNGANGDDGQTLGGGVLQGSASDCVFVCMMAARAQAIKYLKKKCPCVDEGVLLSKLVAYCSKEAHSCVEKAAMMSFVKLRVLDVDEHNSLRGDILEQAMEQDKRLGFVPFFVSTTLGTTSCCSFDNLVEIGPVCKQYPTVWLHTDAAYAGSAFICPEFRVYMQGLEYNDSFNMNANKWLLCNFDTSCMWVKDRRKLTESLIVDPVYLQSDQHPDVIEYRHWGTPLSRRFRALKLWFVLRTYGITKLQEYIRNHCNLAQKFKDKVVADDAFELCNDVKLGLVCFRLKDNNPDDELNKKFLELILKTGKLHMVQAEVQNKYVIRFCVNAERAKEADIEYAWEVIKKVSTHPELREPIDVNASHFIKVCAHSRVQHCKISLPPHRQDRTARSMNSKVAKSKIGGWTSWPLGYLYQDE